MTLLRDDRDADIEVYERATGPERLRRIGVTLGAIYRADGDAWVPIGYLHESLAGNRDAQRKHYEARGYAKR